jgi:hypothetical protein
MAIRYNAKEAAAHGFDRAGPGRYLCEVENATEEQSSKGDPMISLRWRSVERGFTICFDRLVFSEKARGIAHKKLKAMGARVSDEGDVEVEATDLIGLQAMLTLSEREFKGKKNLEPDFEAPGFGYEAVDALPVARLPQPPPIRMPAPAVSTSSDAKFDGDIPF